eukprot:CAMPEP_0184856218 /NCGR_PEP_ID=MMETSP0580-20130426/1384_1 /TAXON_ID=1118495 /ORGANISM="Dactyliosolen fragilissimus" /LENGTH=346 /DNA_ID=CAMNT_0027351095 /DNA_START=304 /DNA_END=1344 /DNA_ORIENTATION=+
MLAFGQINYDDDDDDDDEWWECGEEEDGDDDGVYEEKAEAQNSPSSGWFWRRESKVDEEPINDEREYFESKDESGKDYKIQENENIEREKCKDENEGEHPLRTDEWLVHINLSPLLFPPTIKDESLLFPKSCPTQFSPDLGFRNNTSKRKKDQVLKFSRNGYVLLLEEENMEDFKLATDITNNTRITRIGKWRIDTTGISWDIPVVVPIPNSSKNQTPQFVKEDQLMINLDGEDEPIKEQLSKFPPVICKKTTLHYHADIHLNKFNESPRMIRGIVTRDRYVSPKTFSKLNTPLKNLFSGAFINCPRLPKNILRPVVATFNAIGVGEDTVDYSYKDRGFGLTGGNG